MTRIKRQLLFVIVRVISRIVCYCYEKCTIHEITRTITNETKRGNSVFDTVSAVGGIFDSLGKAVRNHTSGMTHYKITSLQD